MFIVEFCLRHEGDDLKVYGAGLLSFYGELEYCLSNISAIKPFDPATTSTTKYHLTEFQQTYFATESFEDVQSKLM